MRVLSRLSLRIVLPTLALSLALPVLAWTSTSEILALQAESKLWVDGTSSLKSWSCKAGEVNAVVDATPNGIAEVALGEKGVRTVRVTVPAGKMECGNGTMNEHMLKALKVGEYKTIEFRMSGYDVNRGADGVTGTLKGALTLGGVEKQIAIPAVGKREGTALRVTGSYPLNMTEYDLKPPKLMFGSIKVGETVTVKFDLLLKS
ncbi:MAG: YceI family protein [Gemmatimonadaceae bacterium]